MEHFKFKKIILLTNNNSSTVTEYEKGKKIIKNADWLQALDLDLEIVYFQIRKFITSKRLITNLHMHEFIKIVQNLMHTFYNHTMVFTSFLGC